MPQRRAFAPNPMMGAGPARTGAAHPPPNLAPAPQPLPPGQGGPMSGGPMGGPETPSPVRTMPGIPLSPNPMGGGPSLSLPNMGGPPGMGTPPGAGMGGPGGPPSAGGGSGTVDPLDVGPFLTARETGSSMGGILGGSDVGGQPSDRQSQSTGGEPWHLPHESSTTAADLHKGNETDDEEELPNVLLKMLSTMGGR